MGEPMSFKISDAPKNNAPKSTTSRARKTVSNETVDRAVGVMNNLYSAVGVGLVFLQLPASAEILADEKATLEKANREAFQASPKLAEFIANAGSVSSIATFVVAHVMTGLQIANSVRKETLAKTKTETKATTKINSQAEPTETSKVKDTKNGKRENADVGTILGTFQ